MNWILLLVFLSTNWLAGFVASGPIGAEPMTSVNNNNTEDMFGRFVVGQIMGSDSVPLGINSFQLSESTGLFEIILDYVYKIVRKEDRAWSEQFRRVLLSDDLNEKFKALNELSERLERVVTSSKLTAILMEDPRFMAQHSKAFLEHAVSNGNAMHTDNNPCNGPIPDIGKVNGLYGSESRLSMEEEIVAGLNVAAQDPTINGYKLAMIEYGAMSVSDPESRLGAFYATRGYKAGTVGSAAHRMIGAMYLLLGTAGEEKIGRVYNNPAAQALFNEPIQSAAMRCLAYIEHLYFMNVKKENPVSAGALLGSIITPNARDCITKLLSGLFCSSA